MNRLAHRATAAMLCAAFVAAAAPSAQAASDTASVVLSLRADTTALRNATTLPGTASAAARAAALEAARPSAASARRVVEHLRAKGFTVTSNDGWTVAANGPRLTAERLRHTLRADVAAVTGLTPTRAAWRHRAISAGHTGASLASAYDVVRAGSDGAGVTVATVQFAGWDKSDLAAYAAAAGVPMPSLTEIPLGGFDPADTSSGDDFAVAMDQEVLLATAPKAAQRMYFGPPESDDPNLADPLGDAALLYSRIAQDVETGLVDVVSTSWGMCEPDADLDPNGRIAVETQLARIVAAGGTIVAASGDMGAYGCSAEAAPDNTVAVDYPAASPYVVAVGGTRLTGTDGAWTETAWSDPRTGTFKGYASGGGESSSVARPAWQSGLAVAGTRRLVPDVSAMADPNAGFGVYAKSAGGWNLGGGTSASAPLVAGHLAATLASAGRTTGVGDIHDELYANPHVMRDITAGSNLLHAAGPGYDRVTGLGSPRWSALAGVLFGDPVVTAPPASKSLTVPVTVTPVPGMTVTAWTSGEGDAVACDPAGSATPPTSVTLRDGADRKTRVAVAALASDGSCHVATAPVTLDRTAPVARGTIRSVTGTTAATTLTWGATETGSGVTSYDVCAYAVGYGCEKSWTGATATTATTTLTPGRTYQVRVTATDRAGNRSARLTTGLYVLPVDGKTFARTSTWTTTNNAADWYGSHTYSSRKGATTYRSLAGKKYEVFYVAHPAGGLFDVYVAGRRVKRVNTYAATKTYKKVTTVGVFTTRTSRSVKIVVLGAKDARSKGTGVAFDAVRVTF